MDPLTWISPGPEWTEDWAASLAPLLQAGDVIALEAPLGGGKTTFVRGLARGLGIDPDQVSSPTFVIWQIYPGPLPLHHIDAYRLNSPEELEDLGLAEVLGLEDVAVVEWPGLARSLFPPDRLELSLSYASEPEQRRIQLSPQGNWRERLEGWHGLSC